MSNQKRPRISIIPLLLLIVLSMAFFSRAGRMMKSEVTPTPTITAQTTASVSTTGQQMPDVSDASADKGTLEAVAAFVRSNGQLPDYYLSKDQARKMGWSGGSVERYAPGYMIGGDRFGNNEGLLPDKKGRIWTEGDIDTLGQDSRGAKRIVFSSDGLIYYTDDHYESFTQIKGAP